MINYWYQMPFVFRSTNGGEYEYFSYVEDDWKRTYHVPHKELIHVSEGMAWDLINMHIEENEKRKQELINKHIEESENKND